MERNIVKFENQELGAEIRVIDRDGEPWFVAKEICDCLGIANSRDAVSSLDDDEKDVANTDALGENRVVSIISESGLYSLVLRSRKPEAREFRRWVTHEVLPSIRKHGAYMTPPTLEKMLADPRAYAELLTSLADERERRTLNEEKIRYLTPDVPFGTTSNVNGKPRTNLVKPHWRSVKTTTITEITEWQRSLFDLE